jgi:hypothetical protein
MAKTAVQTGIVGVTASCGPLAACKRAAGRLGIAGLVLRSERFGELVARQLSRKLLQRMHNRRLLVCRMEMLYERRVCRGPAAVCVSEVAFWRISVWILQFQAECRRT